MSEPDTLLVLPRLRIQNANAISGVFTWGFPAMTAFVGMMHALERK
ncbi:type I-F CRISPR-associated protein Csy2, partial [Klebsiella pneumoniae]